jgi:hypothetical protein
MALVTLTAVYPPFQFLMTVFIRWVEKCTTVSIIRFFSEALWTFRTRSEGEEIDKWSGWDKDWKKSVVTCFGTLWGAKMEKERWKLSWTVSESYEKQSWKKRKKYIVTSSWTLRGTNLEREKKYIVACFGNVIRHKERRKLWKSTVKIIGKLGFVTVTSRIKLQCVISTMHLIDFVPGHLIFRNIYFRLLHQISAHTTRVVSSNSLVLSNQSLCLLRFPYGLSPINLRRVYR